MVRFTFSTERKARDPGPSDGYLLIEFLVGLLLTSLILGALLSLIRVQALFRLKAMGMYREKLAEHRIQLILDSINDHAAAHRHPVHPRIQAARQIAYTDGRSNPVLSSPGLAPHPDSQAVTFYSSDGRLMPVTEREIIGTNEYRYRVCPRFSFYADMGHVQSWGGIFPYGFIELEAVSRPTRAGSCYDIRARSTSSMIFDGGIQFARHLTAIFPIYDLYTIYLSVDNELRYLSHSGTRNIENQSLGIRIENIRWVSVSTNGLLSLTAIVSHHRKERRLGSAGMLNSLPLTDLIIASANEG